MAKAKKAPAEEPAKPIKKDTGIKKVTRAPPSSKDTSASDTKTILQYLKQQNRPFSVNDIFNNLHSAIGKTSVAKSLEKLVSDGEITDKTFGKQIIYVIKQSAVDVPQEEIDAMDEKMASLKEELAQQKEEWKSVSQELSNLKNTLTMSELQNKIQKLKENNNFLLDKIKLFETGTTKKVDPVEKKKVDALFEEYTKLWRTRKKLFKEAISAITEHMTMSTEEFMIENGMENDPV